MQSAILTLTCLDRPGIVSAVSTFLAQRNCNIADSQQFWDRKSNMFFMRVDFEFSDDNNIDKLKSQFLEIGNKFQMFWQIVDPLKPLNVIIMVSKFDHCLNDLLYRTRINDLNINIKAIITNHNDYESLATSRNIPYYYLPVNKENKHQQEQKMLDIFKEKQADLLVLARYMQILSDDLCSKLKGKVINIHHSFLPSFKGARPYQQAYDRGVKIIGATAHYVTADLDEGPIIEQEVIRVSHAHSADDLVSKGRDIESQVLARAIRYHSQHRVLINGSKTVVFKK